MLKHLAGLVATVIGVFVAFVVGLWALLTLACVAIGAAIVHAFRSRGSARERGRRHRNVIEGDFDVVDENRPGEARQTGRQHPDPPSRRQ